MTWPAPTNQEVFAVNILSFPTQSGVGERDRESGVWLRGVRLRLWNGGWDA